MSAMFENGRPKTLSGNTYLLMTGCGKLYITVNGDKEKKPLEVLGRMGKTGGCIASQLEGLARLTSVSLQEGVPAEKLIRHLRGIRCPSLFEGDGLRVTSCSDAIGKALEMFVNNKVEPEAEAPLCPKCGEKMEKKGNNLVCKNCAFERAD